MLTRSLRIDLTFITSNLTVGVVWDDKGNFGILFTPAVGTSASLGITGGYMQTDAPCINALSGAGTNAGVAFGSPWPILGGEVNNVSGGLPYQNTYNGWDVGFGVGIGLPLTPQVFVGNTTIFQLN